MLNESHLQTRYQTRRIRRHLPMAAGALLVFFFDSQVAVADNVLSSDEDHIQIFMWIANKKASNKARAIADGHCGKYQKIAKFKSLEKNVYAYDCLSASPFPPVSPPQVPPPKPSQRGVQLVIEDQLGKRVGGYEESNALLIGISDYTAGWPDLQNVPQELKSVGDILRQHGFNVRLVLDPTATLQDTFEDFIRRYGFRENQRLLFFFSGHGYTRSRPEGIKGYLVPADAPDPRKDERGFQTRALAMSQILEMARRIEAKHALFLFDSCFSGSVFKTRAFPDSPRHITNFTLRPVRQFISAGSADEEVPANSVFAPLLVRALQGDADLSGDGYITGTELGIYLKEKVPDYSTGQTPQSGKIRDPHLDEGDFVFRVQRKGS